MVKRPPECHDVEVEIDGKRHRGSYSVDRGVIRVSYSDGGSKATQLGGIDPDRLAKRLLSELVREA